MDLIFNIDGDGVYTTVRRGATNGTLEIDKRNINFQEYKHYDKIENGHIVFLRNSKGEPTSNLSEAETFTGKIFNMSQFDYTDRSGKLITLPFTQKDILYNGIKAYEGIIVDHIKAFIANRLDVALGYKNEDGVRINGLFDESALSHRLNKGDIAFSVLEFMLNDFIFNVSQQNLFFGNTFEYKNSIQTNKRAFQVFSPVRYAAAEQGEVFHGATVNDIEIPSSIIPEMAESIINVYTDKYKLKKPTKTKIKLVERAIISGNPDLLKDDLVLMYAYNILEPYGKITTTDGQSYITLEEFKKRTRMFGISEQYEEVFTKLENKKALNPEETNLLLQPQKNFYYNRELEEIGEGVYDYRSEQIKNSEFILVRELLKDDSKLAKLYDAMVENGISQVNFKTAEKVGATYVTNIHNKDLSLKAHLSSILKRSSKAYDYAALGIQQELPSDVLDHNNKFGVQIAKLILNNLVKDKKIYNIDGKPVSGQELAEKYFDSYGANIKDGSIAILEKIGVDIAKSGMLNDINNIFDPKIDMTPDMEKVLNLLKTYGDSKGMSIHDMEGLELIPGTSLPKSTFVPQCYI